MGERLMAGTTRTMANFLFTVVTVFNFENFNFDVNDVSSSELVTS